jgi:hypothetical protein
MVYVVLGPHWHSKHSLILEEIIYIMNTDSVKGKLVKYDIYNYQH